MEVYDLHCDTISAIYEGRKDGKDLSLASSSLQVDLEKMEKGDYRLQTFAIFLDRANTENCFATAGEMTELFKKELEKNRDKISQVYTYQDIQRNKAEGKMSALLSLEEGGIFEKAPEDLRWFYDQGARIATLTWNHENELAYPNCQGDPFKDHPWSWGEERGLKEKGIQALEQMESLGMIRTLADRGGILGLNYCVSFVRRDWKPGQPGATMVELIRQIRYIDNIGGGECLGLGSDFEGIEEAPEMENAGGMQKLAEAMEGAGISHSLTEKIFWKNADRFLRENLG